MAASMHELTSICSLRQAASCAAAQPSPQIFGSATVAAFAVRAALRRPRAADAFAIGAVAAARPLAEWVIHRYVLHAPPRVDPGWRQTIADKSSSAHRHHHLDPGDLDFVLVQQPYAASYAAAWAAIVTGIALVMPGSRRQRLGAGLSGLGAAYASLFAYEWTHLLIHTAYRPQGRWFANRRRQHRLHHFRSEHYWYGVTTALGDRLLRTNPPPRSVMVSPTARTLGY